MAPPETPAAAMEERPPPAVMHPPAAIWVRGGGLGELRRRPLPLAVRQLAAAWRRGLRVGTAAPPEAPAAAMDERPPPAVMYLPAAIWVRGGALEELQRRPLPLAVRRLAAARRRGLRVGTAAPPGTPAAAMEERPPPAVMHPPAAIC